MTGATIAIIIFLVLGVIVLALVGGPAIALIQKGFASIFGPDTSSQAKTDLSLASEFALKRCTLGCQDAELRDYKFTLKDDITVLYDKFCTNVPTAFKVGNEERICDWNANQYPVEVDIKQAEEYSKGGFAGGAFECAFRYDKITSAGTGFSTVFKFALFGTDVVKIISSSDCTGANGMNEFSVNPNHHLYVQTQKTSAFTPFGKIGIWTAIYSSPYYTKINQNEWTKQTLTGNEYNRIVVNGVGDLIVKPVSEKITPINYPLSYITHPGEYLYNKLEVKCPEDSDNAPFKEILPSSTCTAGELVHFCTNKIFSIKCISSEYSPDNKYSFQILYGLAPLQTVTLFKDAEFKSNSVSISSDVSDLNSISFSGVASSVKMADNIFVTLYEDKFDSANTNWGGKNITFKGSAYSLEFGRLQSSSVSSIKLVGTGCSATLYQYENYVDPSVTITSDTPDLRNLRIDWWHNWNDEASSIRVSPVGCIAELYQDINYGGHMIRVTYDSSALGFDNRAKSVRVYYREEAVTGDHTIVVGTQSGSGRVDVYRNGNLAGSVSTGTTTSYNTKSFSFINGDSAEFTAVPSSGYEFQKFCGTAPTNDFVSQSWCCGPSEPLKCDSSKKTSGDSLTRPIYSDGDVYAYFKKK